MPILYTRKLFAITTVILLLPSLADAQIVSRTAGGGVHVRAPFVDVNVPAAGGVAIRGPLGGRRFFGRRLGLVPPVAGQPNAQQPGTQFQEATRGARVPSPAPGYVENANFLPTPEELAAMDIAELQATLREVSRQLHHRLSRLTTGAGWQRHLKVPGEVLFAPTQNSELVKKILTRFDAVAGNPRYAKIAGLPSFIATGATLRQLDAVSAGPRMINPGVTGATWSPEQTAVEHEILPTPAELEQPIATHGEHSILKRASR